MTTTMLNVFAVNASQTRSSDNVNLKTEILSTRCRINKNEVKGEKSQRSKTLSMLIITMTICNN